jgi:hypothetical protein
MLFGDWSFMSRDMHHQYSWCHETFHLLAVSYSKCTVLDYHQKNPLLEEGGGAENVVAL